MMKLIETPVVFEHPDQQRAIVLFPSRPFWVAGNVTLPRVVMGFVDEPRGSSTSTARKDEERLRDLLLNAGVLVYTSASEMRAKKDDLEPRAQLTDVESILVLSLTEGCNLHCPHCYADAKGKHRDEMDTETVLHILDQAADLPWSPDESSIGLIGGEPLLRNDILTITDRISDLGYRIILSTNGLLISDEHIARFREYDIKVSVSLDGDRQQEHEMIRGKGTFNKTLDAIQRLVDAGVPVGVNSFVHMGNIERLPGVFELARKVGVESVNVNTLMYVGRGLSEKVHPVRRAKLYRTQFDIAVSNPEYLKLLIRSNFANKVIAVRGGLKSRYCGIGSNRALYVCSDGTLFPCGDTCLPEFSLGNLKDTTIRSIWDHSPILKDFRALDIDKMNSLCSSCCFRYYCAGDCRGEHFQKYGDFLSPHFKCEEIKESILEIMWMLAEKPDFLKDRADAVLDKARLVTSDER